MPGGDLGVKAVTIYPGNPPARPAVQGEFVLFDGATGRVRAVIEAEALTRWKTAADSALAASILARPDVRTLLMVGAGNMARPLIEAHLAVRPGLERILLWNRRPEARP